MFDDNSDVSKFVGCAVIGGGLLLFGLGCLTMWLITKF